MSTGTGRVGIVGWPVEHSLSPAMQNAAFEALGIDMEYVLLPTPPDQFEDRIAGLVAEGYAGWNVTVPHKERMYKLLDEARPEVAATGACNTVKVEHGRLVGYNTDPVGFLAGLDEAGGILDGSSAVLLGAGGAARAVAWALASRGHEVHIFARRVAQAQAIAGQVGTAVQGAWLMAHLLEADALTDTLSRATLIVNCTAAGMAPHTGASPLPPGVALPGHLLAYDLVYRPQATHFLRQARGAGCRTQDGLAMLVGQGAAAFEIWTGKRAPADTMREACEQVLQSEESTEKKLAAITGDESKEY